MKIVDAYIKIIRESSVSNIRPYLETVWRERYVSEAVEPYPHGELSDKHQMAIHSSIASSHISDNESDALNDYGYGSRPTNKKLIDFHNGEGKIEKSDLPKYATLDGVLNKHKTTSEFDVYSGLRFSPTTFFEHKSSKTKFHLPAYTSSSTSLSTAAGFCNGQTVSDNDNKHGVTPDENNKVRHILKIKVPSGTHAMSMINHSESDHENEILIHRGHDIEVSHTPHTYMDNGQLHHIWHGTLIQHKPSKLG